MKLRLQTALYEVLQSKPYRFLFKITCCTCTFMPVAEIFYTRHRWQRSFWKDKALTPKMEHMLIYPLQQPIMCLFTAKPGNLLAHLVVVLLLESQEFQSIWCSSRRTPKRKTSLCYTGLQTSDLVLILYLWLPCSGGTSHVLYELLQKFVS